jgi:hypothetical protein
LSDWVPADHGPGSSLEELDLMHSRRTAAIAIGLLMLAGLVAAAGTGPVLVTGADHLDSPLVKIDGRIDLTDIYAFRWGLNSSVLALNVNPLTSPASTKFAYFRPGALYEFKIDTNLDGRADVAYRVRFFHLQSKTDGSRFQTYAVKRATGAAANRHEWTGTTVAVGSTTAYGHALRIAPVLGGGKAFAGPRDDPFYFDLVGFKHLKERLLAGSTTLGAAGETANCALADTDPSAHLLACFTGTDTFAGTNVSSIVLQLPNGMIGGSGHTIGIWATTSMQIDGGYQQIDRLARPAINTVFNVTDAQKDIANVTGPRDDRTQMLARTKAVLGAFNHVLTSNSLSAYSAAQIDAIAHVLLPDELTYKVADGHGFAWFAGNGSASLANLRLNGRRPINDVINAEFGLVTNFHITSDGVDANDVAFPGTFPYLAAPH